jgi:hypothetical protein
MIHRPSRFFSRLTSKSAGSPAVATFPGKNLIYECLQHSGDQYGERLRPFSFGWIEMTWVVSMPAQQQFNGTIKLGASLRTIDSVRFPLAQLHYVLT